MFELPKKTVHSIVSKMIIKEELLVCGVWVGVGGIRVRVRVRVRVRIRVRVRVRVRVVRVTRIKQCSGYQ